MTCPPKCRRTGCENHVRRLKGAGRPPVYCSDACSHYMSRRGVHVNVRPAKDMGPAVPLNGWTPKKARARMVRIVAEELRNGVLMDALAERFSVSVDDIRRIAVRHRVRVPRQGAWTPPYGPPVR